MISRVWINCEYGGPGRKDITSKRAETRRRLVCWQWGRGQGWALAGLKEGIFFWQKGRMKWDGLPGPNPKQGAQVRQP